MQNNMLFDALKKLTQEKEEKKKPMKIYRDENTGQIKEIPLDSAAAIASTNYNPAKLIHNFMFGY